jgi:hypothetical protein
MKILSASLELLLRTDGQTVEDNSRIFKNISLPTHPKLIPSRQIYNLWLFIFYLFYVFFYFNYQRCW